jgi:hypothetical protein
VPTAFTSEPFLLTMDTEKTDVKVAACQTTVVRKK